MADILAFGKDGVHVLKSSFESISSKALSPVCIDFCESTGWSVKDHVRVVGDTTGDGRTDLIGFGREGVWVARNKGNGVFGPSTLRLQYFGSGPGAGSWSTERHVRFVADLRGTGRVDIVGFSDWAVHVSLNDGDGTFAPPHVACAGFGLERGGWSKGKHLRMLADVTGNGVPDIVGFGDKDVCVAVNNGDGTFGPLRTVLSAFACQGNLMWSVRDHPRMLADLTGNGTVDIVGFASLGVYVALNDGKGGFREPACVLGTFGDNAGGWKVDKHPRFVADLTGDGKGDIVGFGDAGVSVALNNGDGTFQNSRLVLQAYGYQAGWRVEKHPRYLVDLTGNGCADIVGFFDDGVYVAFNDGKGGFGAAQKLSDNFGCGSDAWSAESTIRMVVNLAQR